MNARTLHRVLFASISSAVLLAAPAHAGLFRAYLSQNGNDANPCTLQQPCRLLPAAIAAVNDGGEIWMVDSANYNTAPVSITKSVTILAIPGALGSIVASGGDAIDVATPNARVTLRNLVVLNFSAGAHGINFSNGARLTVEECEIYGLPQNGITFTAPGGGLVVKNTTIHNIAGAGVFVAGTLASSVTAALEHVSLLSVNTGFSVGSSASVTLNDSVVTNTQVGVTATESGGAGSRVTIVNSVIRASTTGISLTSPTASDTVRVTMSRSTLSHNPLGMDVQSAAGDVKVTLDDNVIQNNTTAINMSGGVVFTRGNNTLNFTTNGIVGGSLTALAGI
ncbi:MAG TPA: right-handed parallel beta-helix repeat-containing protein [Casimicrobiaceae bacterium]